MKRNSFFLLTLGAALLFSVSPVQAQFTITIPKIPKIKREKPATVTTETSTTTTTTTSSNDDSKPATTTETASGNDEGGGAAWWYKYQIDEIAKLKKQFDEWDPENQYFPSSITNDDYTGLALSTTERAKWLKDHKQPANARLEAAFDGLRTSILKRMPEHKLEPKSFAFHNVAEEKMLIAEMRDVPGIKVFKTGLSEGGWLIEKNDYGLPTARYKHGALYGRNPSSEDKLCRVWYINIVQDYSGGGTYGASGTRFVGKSYMPCPAGM
ncbi:MAG: hypothetical protein ABI791_06755 [Acidobacteriota bacterium]